MPSGAGEEYHVYGVWWKSERDIGTRNGTPESKPGIETRNRNAESTLRGTLVCRSGK